jgi:uncharacterized protein (DUF427 family)
MPRAIWNGTVIAETSTFEEVEGNVYFPPDSLVAEHFAPSSHTSHCGWKGTASYYDVVVGEERSEKAAWYYPEPLDAAANIKDYVAFWGDVTVER